MSQNNRSNLSHLVRFGAIALLLQVNSFFDSGFSEQMMAAANSFLETESPKQMTQLLEADVFIRHAAEDSLEQFLVFAHCFQSRC